MQDPVLNELLNYWESLRGGRIAPARSEVDPREIEGVLEHAFILEAAGGTPRFRLAGMRVCELMGMEMRAMPATAIIAPGARAQFSALVTSLFAGPAILRLGLECAGPGRPGLVGEMLLLPMTGDDGRVTRLLGCLVTAGLSGVPPHRFAIREVARKRIVATKTSEEAPADPGFAEPASVFIPPATQGEKGTGNPQSGRPYLRLVKSDG